MLIGEFRIRERIFRLIICASRTRKFQISVRLNMPTGRCGLMWITGWFDGVDISDGLAPQLPADKVFQPEQEIL